MESPVNEQIEADVHRIIQATTAPPEIKEQAWQAFFTAGTPTAFYQRFDSLPLPNSVRTDLWNLKFNQRKIGPAAVHSKGTVRGALPELPSAGRVRELPSSAAGEARLRGIAKRLGMDYHTMMPGDRQALEQIQHEMNLGALQNIAGAGPSWWPTTAEARRMAAARAGVTQERAPGGEAPQSTRRGLPPVPQPRR